MTTIASLAVKLSADPSQFVSGIQKGAAATKSLHKTIRNLAAVGVAGLGVALAGAGVSSIKDFITNAAEGAIATTRLARELGATTEGVASLGYAMQQTGGDTADVGAGLQALNDALTAATTGSSATADVFNRLGVSADQLARIPVDQAFLKVATAIQRVNDPAARAALATGLFGDKAKALLPLLNQGERGLQAAADAAKKLGLSFSAVDGGKLENAAAALAQLKARLEGIAVQIAIGLAPYVEALAQEFDRLADSGKVSGSTVSEGFRSAAHSIGDAVDVARVFAGIGASLQTVYATLFADLAAAIEALLRLGAQLPDTIGGAQFKDAADEVAKWVAGLDAAGDDYKKKVVDAFSQAPAAAGIDNFFDRLNARAAQAAVQMNKVRDAAGAVPEAAKKLDLFKQSKTVFDAARSPLQKFRDELAKLNALLNTGAIGWETYARGASAAVAALDSANRVSEVRLPSAAVRGTAEGASAAIQGVANDTMQNRENPQQRVEKILQQSQSIDKEQLAVMKQVAEILKRQAVPDTAKF